MNNTEIFIITGGSFQGKSLISLALANQLEYSGVLSTDAVRNVLKILNPEKIYLGSSTYLLTTEELEMQFFDVSNVIKKLIEIYESRGEKIIIEGMHFSSNFFFWAIERGIKIVTLDNQVPFSERILLKGKTRSKLRLYLDGTQESTWIKVNEQNAKSTAYYVHKDRIEKIHQEILSESRKLGLYVVQFREIQEAISKVKYILLNS